jgi:hypothetical protein
MTSRATDKLGQSQQLANQKTMMCPRLLARGSWCARDDGLLARPPRNAGHSNAAKADMAADTGPSLNVSGECNPTRRAAAAA